MWLTLSLKWELCAREHIITQTVSQLDLPSYQKTREMLSQELIQESSVSSSRARTTISSISSDKIDRVRFQTLTWTIATVDNLTGTGSLQLIRTVTLSPQRLYSRVSLVQRQIFESLGFPCESFRHFDFMPYRPTLEQAEPGFAVVPRACAIA
ncbi:aromatic-amino-acid aminotransferase [Penicillium chermesinum]|uniref:Aromatic-amino-acid aminotransferase n=1 Tax=Penicillium chermesinum TaxID=63820 RepID=A0A9W9NKS1_9EURO|nr:aromatic-amino-acid aminotransferase [Penicillium chermesinum]KAJ5220509.1 aromatic-amino-acid aminotransferase [Penicillium chermesinum]